MYFCNECNIVFEKFQQKANHDRWSHKNFNFENYSTKLKKSIENSLNRKLGNYIHELVKCDKKTGCNNLINIKYRPNRRKNFYYCSRSCANSRIWNDAQKKLHLSRFYDVNDLYGKAFQKNQGNINNKKIFSSKNERYIVQYFKENFLKDQWKSGGSIIFNTKMARDMWSDKLKICFEYDGIWHFKDIHGQLKDKQFKDSLLEQWCIQNNYRLIRIDEIMYENIEQIIDLIYNKSDQVIKIGSRY